MGDHIQFAPFQSFVDASFFSVLANKKLTELKLDESSIPIHATYSVPLVGGRPPTIHVTGSGFSGSTGIIASLHRVYQAPGEITNTNTIDSFREMNKADLMNSEGKKLLQRIRDGSALEDPSELTRFHIAAFSDLKKYKFYYWFAFPAISCDAVFGSQSALQGDEVKKMSDAVETYANSTNDIKQLGFFLVKAVPEGYVIGQLKHYKDFFKESEEVRVGFVDPCTIEGVPGWPLRNFLVLLVELGVRKVKILSYRDHAHTDTGSKSFWIDVEIAGIAKVPKVTGWERNAAGKLAPKMSDLGALVNPEQLANQAVDLNLRLMKWRIAPEVDLDSIQNARCLLLGAGTLGSYIARGLLAWGVRNVTFVDNGKVSFSNPVRQSLYRFEHCLDGGAPKAATAAAVLNEIFPAVTASGYQLEIPMAGHTLSNEARQHKEYDELVSLIESHDVVFLLMDSRESRWLPTVIASALSKLVINVALGFDSYLVMRHGISEPNSDEHHPHLGCYFCNDVVAPVDSVSGLTLDQMCTVTRPGVAMLASATAVELLASVLQQPQKGLTPPSQQDNTEQGPLSTVPHQIRGFLGNFDTMKIWGPSYPSCSACSPNITKAWREQGWEFVKQALNTPDIINDISGLSEVQKRAEELLDDNWDSSTASEGELI